MGYITINCNHCEMNTEENLFSISYTNLEEPINLCICFTINNLFLYYNYYFMQNSSILNIVLENGKIIDKIFSQSEIGIMDLSKNNLKEQFQIKLKRMFKIIKLEYFK